MASRRKQQRGGKSREEEGGGSHDRRLSKALSWLLRHHIELAFKHLQSDDKDGERQVALTTGLVDVEAVLKTERLRGFTFLDVKNVVELNDKQRFALVQRPSDGAWLIRANQGHTIQGINPDLTPMTETSSDIVHGTYLNKLDKIMSSGGLSRMSRNHIHFSKGLPGDSHVISGMRADCDVLIYVNFAKATQAGFEFYESANGVILCPGDERGILPTNCFDRIVNRKTGKTIPSV